MYQKKWATELVVTLCDLCKKWKEGEKEKGEEGKGDERRKGGAHESARKSKGK
jgi:hypothetical protein